MYYVKYLEAQKNTIWAEVKYELFNTLDEAKAFAETDANAFDEDGFEKTVFQEYGTAVMNGENWEPDQCLSMSLDAQERGKFTLEDED